MAQPKQYPNNAARQRAHRKRLAERAALPPLPEVNKARLINNLLEALEALETSMIEGHAPFDQRDELMHCRDTIKSWTP